MGLIKLKIAGLPKDEPSVDPAFFGEIGDGFQFLLTEGDQKCLADKTLKILSKETALRETLMAQIEEILAEKKKNN